MAAVGIDFLAERRENSRECFGNLYSSSRISCRRTGFGKRGRREWIRRRNGSSTLYVTAPTAGWCLFERRGRKGRTGCGFAVRSVRSPGESLLYLAPPAATSRKWPPSCGAPIQYMATRNSLPSTIPFRRLCTFRRPLLSLSGGISPGPRKFGGSTFGLSSASPLSERLARSFGNFWAPRR